MLSSFVSTAIISTKVSVLLCLFFPHTHQGYERYHSTGNPAPPVPRRSSYLKNYVTGKPPPVPKRPAGYPVTGRPPPVPNRSGSRPLPLTWHPPPVPRVVTVTGIFSILGDPSPLYWLVVNYIYHCILLRRYIFTYLVEEVLFLFYVPWNGGETCISSVESQKGVITIQQCSIEKHKGTITVQSLSQ